MSDTEPTEPANTAKSTESDKETYRCGICAKEFHYDSDVTVGQKSGVKVHILHAHTKEERLDHLVRPEPAVIEESNYQEDV